MELSPEAREIKRARDREYMKAWRDRNPEKVRENCAKYWERKAQKAREAAGAQQ